MTLVELPRHEGWAVVVRAHPAKNADDLHVVRLRRHADGSAVYERVSNGKTVPGWLVLTSLVRYRSQARDDKKVLVKANRLASSDWKHNNCDHDTGSYG